MSETVALSIGLPSTIREGEVLGGRYRLEREIGRGALGTVWSAVHLTLGQRVAIKLIAAEHAQAPEARARFGAEAKAAARLRSRYVVRVYDDGETAAGTPYIVLEYLEGETLEQRLGREHHVPLNDAVRITRHVARALSRAHAQGIVHRDLKPANVFLTRSEDDPLGWLPKVLDFGIAKLQGQGIASATTTGALLGPGTALFMSPEQVRGLSAVDARSDLYSLGMLFFNMITGTYAFTGTSFADLLVHICTKQLPDLRALAPWIPGSVGDWFQRASARDPNRRFQSAEELIESLDRALGVSTGALSDQPSEELKLDTLRGYAPPPGHELPHVAPSESSEGKVHDGIITQARVTDLNDPELMVPTASRAPLFMVGGLLLVLMLGGGWLAFGTRIAPSSAPPPAAPPSSAPRSSAPPSSALPSSAPPSSALPSVIPPEPVVTALAVAPPARAARAPSAVSAPAVKPSAHPIKPAQSAQPARPAATQPAPRPRVPTPDLGF